MCVSIGVDNMLHHFMDFFPIECLEIRNKSSEIFEIKSLGLGVEGVLAAFRCIDVLRKSFVRLILWSNNMSFWLEVGNIPAPRVLEGFEYERCGGPSKLLIIWHLRYCFSTVELSPHAFSTFDENANLILESFFTFLATAVWLTDFVVERVIAECARVFCKCIVEFRLESIETLLKSSTKL